MTAPATAPGLLETEPTPATRIHRQRRGCAAPLRPGLRPRGHAVHRPLRDADGRCVPRADPDGLAAVLFAALLPRVLGHHREGHRAVRGVVLPAPATDYKFAAEAGWTRPSDLELGYRLRRAAWGRGLATEASSALVRPSPSSTRRDVRRRGRSRFEPRLHAGDGEDRDDARPRVRHPGLPTRA